MGDSDAATSDRPAVASTTSADEEFAAASDLDDVVARIRRLMADVAAAAWRLGHGLGVIRAKQLWKQRLREDGSPAYAAFDAFCAAELEMTGGNAYELIDLAANYTLDQVRTHGRQKLVLLLRVPDAAKPEVLRAIEAGASKREVQHLLREAKARSGVVGTQRRTGRKHMPVGRNQGDRTLDHFVVSVPSEITGHFVTRATMNDEHPRPATSIADDPVAVMKLSTKVTLVLSLRYDDEGCILLDCSFEQGTA